jgi:poly(3-hydroxybutyrate) depolymerase
VVDDVEQAYWMIVPTGYAASAPAQLELSLATGHGDHDWYLRGARDYVDPAVLTAIVNTSPGPHRTPAMLAQLVEHLGEEYCVDPDRIHVTGFSSSQMLAAELACVASDRIASVSSSMGSGAPAIPCAPERPVPLLSFTGDTDRAGMQSLVDMWADLNECDPEPAVENLGSGVFRKTYQGCAADVVFYDIEGLGHQWPMREPHGKIDEVGFAAQYQEVDYFEENAEFFATHPMP